MWTIGIHNLIDLAYRTHHIAFIITYIYHLYSYVQEVQHNIDKLKEIHITAVCMKITRENKVLRYNFSKYIYNKLVHNNSISLLDSFRSKKYYESQDSHNFVTEVDTQISSIEFCWVLYKSILLYNMFIGPFKSLDIPNCSIQYLTFPTIKVVQLRNEKLTIFFGYFLTWKIDLLHVVLDWSK